MDGSISIIEMQDKAIHVESRWMVRCDEKNNRQKKKREIGKD